MWVGMVREELDWVSMWTVDWKWVREAAFGRE